MGAPPSPQAQHASTSRLPRRIYLPRTVGLGLGALCAGAGLSQAQAPIWSWVVMLTYCAAWPHLAYQIARRSAAPADAERRNVLFDALAGGFWAVAMAFNVLPSVLLLTSLSMNNLGVGGVRLFWRGLVATLLGAGIGLLTLGWRLEPATSFVTLLWCLPFLLAYPMVLGLVTYRLSIELSQRKDELRLEKRRADEASAAQARALAELAARDDLTGLYNRRYMSELLRQQQAACERSGTVFTAALADLDRFKDINDSHGHAAGDSVLQRFAEICRSAIRVSDTVGRWGGEEFIIIFPAASAEEAAQAAERLRARVASTVLTTPSGQPLRFTVSIGLTEHRRGESVETTLDRADGAMYQAKQQGRDRVLLV